jgi:HEPN domain-containing protein
MAVIYWDMDRLVTHWVERAKYDMDTAKAMLDTGRYLYVAYMCQQAIEKMLKAMIAKHGKQNFPVHNLNRLSEIAEIKDDLPNNYYSFMAELTPYHIEARYGDYKESLSEIIDDIEANKILGKTSELYKWLYQKMK